MRHSGTVVNRSFIAVSCPLCPVQPASQAHSTYVKHSPPEAHLSIQPAHGAYITATKVTQSHPLTVAGCASNNCNTPPLTTPILEFMSNIEFSERHMYLFVGVYCCFTWRYAYSSPLPSVWDALLCRSFGIQHDGNGNDCEPIGKRPFVMSPQLLYSTSLPKWSRCSRQYITRFLE